MGRGFEVYRALSPASRADLLIMKTGTAYAVEVRTGRRDTEGHVWCAPRVADSIDVLAVVVHDEQATFLYHPLTEKGGSLGLPCEEGGVNRRRKPC